MCSYYYFRFQSAMGALCPGVKRPGREGDNSPPSIVEVKNSWRYTSYPHRSSWRVA